METVSGGSAALLAAVGLLAAAFAAMYLARVKSRLAWRLLVNALSGVAALLLINTVSDRVPFAEPVRTAPWTLAAVCALGAPGAVLLAIIGALF